MREETNEDKMKSIETKLLQLKTPQSIAGDSWEIYRTQLTTNRWDVEVFGANTTAAYDQRWKVTYIIEGVENPENAFADFTVEDGTVEWQGNFGIPMGFDLNYEDSGTDPLVLYVSMKPSYNWSTSGYGAFKVYAQSPYKGRLVIEMVDRD